MVYLANQSPIVMVWLNEFTRVLADRSWSMDAFERICVEHLGVSGELDMAYHKSHTCVAAAE